MWEREEMRRMEYEDAFIFGGLDFTQKKKTEKENRKRKRSLAEM